MGEFTMPSLGADMTSGVVSKWLVHPGDVVQRGDIVAVVETDKSTIEVEVFEDGKIEALLVPEGEEVAVGTPLAHLVRVLRPARAPRAGAPAPPATQAHEAVPSARSTEPARLGAGLVASPPEAAHGQPPVLSPVLRHLADRLGVDLGRVHGSGIDGSVTRTDIEQAARARAARGTRVRSSPYARRRAAELGLDLRALTGTGPGGAVVAHDVSAPATTDVLPTLPAAPGPSTEQPVRDAGQRQAALRHSIGNLMARSKREIPHYYLSTTIDARAAVAWLEDENARRAVAARLALPALLIKATARAVGTVPEMNGFFVDDRFVHADSVHVGVAVSLRTGGVVAPAIHDVDRLGIDELMRALTDLVGRVRRGSLRASEMRDPTITVTNLGDLGVESVFGVIYPPQVALVGFGRVVDRPYAAGGMVGVRPSLIATLSADHRASDGHRGGRFLAQIDRLLQEPADL